LLFWRQVQVNDRSMSRLCSLTRPLSIRKRPGFLGSRLAAGERRASCRWAGYLEFGSAAPRNQAQLFGLAGTAAAGKVFDDVNFVPILVSAAIFVAGGAVSKCFNDTQLAAATCSVTLAAYANSNCSSTSPVVPCQDNHARPHTRQQAASRAGQVRLQVET
jgi:hypothetical protein